MRINKYIFWICSLIISLISCWVFERSSTEIYSNSDYMLSLNLPSDADTPVVAVASGFMAAFFTGIIHLITHLIILIILFVTKSIRTISIVFTISKTDSALHKIILIVTFLIIALLIKDYIYLIKIGFFIYSTIFLIIAILTTLIYAIWIMNLLIKKIKLDNI